MRTYLFLGILTFIIFLGAWLFLDPDEEDIRNYPQQNGTIVAFGDSLVFGYGATEGNDFVSVLERRLGRTIINLGISGNTSSDGVARMDEVTKKKPGIVILLLGGNDALRRIDTQVTKNNLARLITTFQKDGAVVILLGVRGGIIGDDHSEMYEELAHEYDTIYVSDVLSGIFLKPELMFDGIHPNDAGYARIAERLFHVFKEYDL